MSEQTIEDILQMIENNKGAGGLDLSGRDLSDIDLSAVQIEAELVARGLADPMRFPAWIHWDKVTGEVLGINLQRVNLAEANLCGANLAGASLRSTNLQGAVLRGANLRQVDLGEAILRGADLAEAGLHGADFFRTNLQKANFDRADLRGAYLRRARSLPEAFLSGAMVDEDTKWPAGFRLGHAESSQGAPSGEGDVSWWRRLLGRG